MDRDVNGTCHMQQTSFFHVADRAGQSILNRLLRVIIFLGLLATLIGIAALGTKAGGAAANESPGSLSSPGAYSSELSNGMPLP
jgi:hypothetical protein